jgi:hypothetical protein
MALNPESSAAKTIPVSSPSPQVSSTASATPARSRPGVVRSPASHPPFRAPVGSIVSVRSGAFTSPAMEDLTAARCGDTADWFRNYSGSRRVDRPAPLGSR